MHQPLIFIARRSNTAQHVSGILLPIIRSFFLTLHILLNQMAAIVLCSFRLTFLYAYISPACLSCINLGFVSPCIIIHSNKSSNQMHQSLRFISRRSNTDQHVSGILLSPSS